MKNAESLKGKIKAFSNKHRLRPQEVLQMYFFERFLERLSLSKYKENLIVKGGFLISSMIGIANRTTMDMDTTAKGLPLNEEAVKRIMTEIVEQDLEDGIQFNIDVIEYIRENSVYENFRVHLFATYGKIKNAMKVDITIGDTITPGEVDWSYNCLFEDKRINVMAYPLVTVIAEKFETVIFRNIATTRMRDFYDLHILYELNKSALNFDLLKTAIERTAQGRGSLTIIAENKDIIKDIMSDKYLQEIWQAYLRENRYIGDLEFRKVVSSLKEMSEKLDFT